MPQRDRRPQPIRAAARLAVAALAMLATPLLAGCARRAPDLFAAYEPGPGGTPLRGGRIVLTREEDPDFLDPALSYGTYSAPLISAVFRTLLEYADAPGTAGATLLPEIAGSLPDVRENGTLYAFKIRPEARFGPPVNRRITAADFQYAIERLFKVGSPGVSFYGGIVGARDVIAGRDSVLAGVIARGDSLYVRLEKPDPMFLQAFSMSFSSPIPREVGERHPNDYSQHTVPSGPYRIAEFTPRHRVLLVRNPAYWGRPAWADTIELRLGVSTNNAAALIRRGLADGGIFEVPPGEFARMLGDSLWKRQIQVADGLNVEYLFMNVRQPPFHDVRVRQAVCWALDRDALTKVYSGKAEPAGEFLPPGMPGAARLGRYMPRDVARARRLLAEAGHPRGLKTRLHGWTTEPGPREMQVIQQQLAEAGIEAELDLGEAAGYTSMAEDTANHVAFGIYSWYADYVDPSNFLDVLFNGRRITATNNLNLSLLDDSLTNAMIEAALPVTDPTERAARWRLVDERIMDLAPVAVTIHQLESRLWGPRVGGWYRHVTRILKLEALYVKRARAAPGPPGEAP